MTPFTRWSRRIAAYALSVVVHLSTLAFLVAAVALVVAAPAHQGSWLLAALCLAIGMVLRPRTARLARDAEVLPVSRAPELYAVAHRVADLVGVARPVSVAVRDLMVGAAYDRIGLRRRPVLTVGLPLWLTLAPAQRVALLARAYAAESEADGLVVGGALATLGEWRQALLTDVPGNDTRFEANTRMQMQLGGFAPETSYDAAGVFGRIVGRVLGAPVLLVEYTLRRLAHGERAERAVRAARLARRAATPEALAVVEELTASPGRVLAPVQSAVIRGEDAATIRGQALDRAATLRAASRAPAGTAVRDGEAPPRVLGDTESARTDEELMTHYTRALRGFGLIV